MINPSTKVWSLLVLVYYTGHLVLSPRGSIISTVYIISYHIHMYRLWVGSRARCWQRVQGPHAGWRLLSGSQSWLDPLGDRTRARRAVSQWKVTSLLMLWALPLLLNWSIWGTYFSIVVFPVYKYKCTMLKWWCTDKKKNTSWVAHSCLSKAKKQSKGPEFRPQQDRNTAAR